MPRQKNTIHITQAGQNTLGVDTADYITGSDGADRIQGRLGNDKIFGGGGNDFLVGGQGDDVLSGGDGADVLIGLNGHDVLTGGADADTFGFYVFGGSVSDSLGDPPYLQDNLSDTITDFLPGEDKMVLQNFNLENLNLTDLTSPYLSYDRASGNLTYDPDGAGASVGYVVVHLVGNPDLQITDLVLIG